MKLLVGLVRLPSQLALLCVRVYQWTISPLLGPSCRFHPSCSSYACSCLRDHGLVRGGWFTVRRLSRCHPWNPGGVDLPPPKGTPARPLGAAQEIDGGVG